MNKPTTVIRNEAQATSGNSVTLDLGTVNLEGILTVPPNTIGMVVFAHGSGSSRFSSRNQFVARCLNEAGLGTLLFDLLTEQEEAIDLRTRHLRFDIPLLARRLAGAVDWVKAQEDIGELPVGVFGSSTGAAAALIAAAQRPDAVGAVVSRGGRPDLAGEALPEVKAPTLFIIGENDREVIELNREAARQMTIEPLFEIVPGATHLFEEPGTLEIAAERARDWFHEKLAGNAQYP